MSDEEIVIHDETFKPQGRGRPPIFDVSKLVYQAAKNEGLWISKVMTNEEANSATGQLKRRGFEVSSAKVDQKQKEVFLRYNRGQ